MCTFLIIYAVGMALTFSATMVEWKRKGNENEHIHKAFVVCGFFALVWPITLWLLIETVRERKWKN